MPSARSHQVLDSFDGLNVAAGADCGAVRRGACRKAAIGKISPLNHEELVPGQLEIGCRRAPANRLDRIAASDVFATDRPSRDSR